MITLKNIKEAKATLQDITQYTPLTHAPILSRENKSNIYLKKENLQITY